MTVTSHESSVVQTISLTPGEVAFYKAQGYLPLPGFVAAEHVAALREEVFGILAANGVDRAALAMASTAADKLRQFSQYVTASRLDELINSDQTLGVASRLVGGAAVRYLPFTAVKAASGGGTFHFHQDNNYTRHDPALASINIWVALVDMTPDNGCLQIIPGSHTGQLDSHNSPDGDTHQEVDVDPDTALPIRMRAGDAVAFSRWTVHGSGPNNTAEPRVAYALQYHRDDARWYDKDADEWRLIIDTPKFVTSPVERLSNG